MKRTATALWKGDLKEGHGQISGESGAFEALKYSFKTRFEDEPGTNPEELIAAAHAGCFSMALSNELAKAGMNPQSVETAASVTLAQDEGGFSIPAVHLKVKANVPGASENDFETAANNAKTGCPVSKLLKAEITMETELQN